MPPATLEAPDHAANRSRQPRPGGPRQSTAVHPGRRSGAASSLAAPGLCLAHLPVPPWGRHRWVGWPSTGSVSLAGASPRVCVPVRRLQKVVGCSSHQPDPSVRGGARCAVRRFRDVGAAGITVGGVHSRRGHANDVSVVILRVDTRDCWGRPAGRPGCRVVAVLPAAGAACGLVRWVTGRVRRWGVCSWRVVGCWLPAACWFLLAVVFPRGGVFRSGGGVVSAGGWPGRRRAAAGHNGRAQRQCTPLLAATPCRRVRRSRAPVPLRWV